MDKPAVKKANEILAKYYPNTKPAYSLPRHGGSDDRRRGSQSRRQGFDVRRPDQRVGIAWPVQTGLVPPLDWSTTYHGGPHTFGYAVWKRKTCRY
jgi:hypothetical protein